MIIWMKIVYMKKFLVNIKIVIKKFKEKKKMNMKLIVKIDQSHVHIVKKLSFLNLCKIILMFVKKLNFYVKMDANKKLQEKKCILI